MKPLPEGLVWGVDVTIKKLRPGASFQLHGSNFIYWNDPNGLDAPTWEEIETVMEEDRKKAAEWLEQNTYVGQKPVEANFIVGPDVANGEVDTTITVSTNPDIWP